MVGRMPVSAALVLIVALAGCSDQTGSGGLGAPIPDEDRTARAGEETAAAATEGNPPPMNVTYRLNGTIDGLGSTALSHYAGTFTPDQPFLVGTGATRLEFVLDWPDLPPANLVLHLLWPSGQEAYIEEADIALLEGQLVVTVLDPEAGEWMASAVPDGPAIDLDYTIRIDVLYA